MEEYEFINKDDLDESLPPKTTEMASSAVSATSVFQDRNTHALGHLRTEDDDDSDEETEVSSPVAQATAPPRVAQVGLLLHFRHPVHSRNTHLGFSECQYLLIDMADIFLTGLLSGILASEHIMGRLVGHGTGWQ